ncbi:DUF305 domain-containing protein [Rhodococcus olei]|uniref:DUF305 domain-containing protein n=1 Tax=Rhodococcus olei TaxID=2161675 RepID=A0ABP8P140_9NOCA
MNTRTTVGLVAALATSAVLVAGCSGTDDSGHSMGSMGSMSMTMSAPAGEAASDHNMADVMWTQMMIPHHQQAVEMAALAEGRTGNTQLLALAAQIKAAQNPEIELMTGWLTAWGQPTMAAGMDHSMHGSGGTSGMMPGGSMPGGSMSDGMMSAEQMTRLQNATGAEFDRAWLEMMIAHHQGAIDSSTQIQANGQSDQVHELAGKIIAGQQAEIDRMRAMLGQ